MNDIRDIFDDTLESLVSIGLEIFTGSNSVLLAFPIISHIFLPSISILLYFSLRTSIRFASLGSITFFLDTGSFIIIGPLLSLGFITVYPSSGSSSPSKSSSSTNSASSKSPYSLVKSSRTSSGLSEEV